MESAKKSLKSPKAPTVKIQLDAQIKKPKPVIPAPQKANGSRQFVPPKVNKQPESDVPAKPLEAYKNPQKMSPERINEGLNTSGIFNTASLWSGIYPQHVVDELDNNAYYIAKLDEQGRIINYHADRLFTIPCNSVVRFQMSYSHEKTCRDARLIINKPKRKAGGDVLEYTVTNPVPWSQDQEKRDTLNWEGSELDYRFFKIIKKDTEASQYMMEFRVEFTESGSFFIQVQYSNEKDKRNKFYTEPSYINVQPQLNVGPLNNQRQIKQRNLRMITVISRCLGKIDRWPKVFDNIQEVGYNAVHFTPFQTYGQSKSHYSIANQSQIDDYFFAAKVAPEMKFESVRIALQKLREKGVLSFCDIVLNQTADNSPWLHNHQEATFNQVNTPKLYSALLLDQKISEFSKDFMNKKIEELNEFAPKIESEDQLQAVMNSLRTNVLEKSKIHEFFISDADMVVKKQLDTFFEECKELETKEYLDPFIAKFEFLAWFSNDHYKIMRDNFMDNHGCGPQRKPVTLKDVETCATFFYLECDRSIEGAKGRIKEVMEGLNLEWIERVDGFLEEAYKNLEDSIRNNKSNITATNPLVPRYFTQIGDQQKIWVALNGHVKGSDDPTQDFINWGWHYLRRTLDVYSDCVKLRYGQCPSDSPFLWTHMKKYVEDLASICDGFRLDNALQTPIQVSQYMLQAARSRNKNLYVMADLYTASVVQDAAFVRQLNINGLVRVLQNETNATNLQQYMQFIHDCGGQELLGQTLDEQFTDIYGKAYKPLIPRRPEEILYDCTHDTPSTHDKYLTSAMALPLVAINGLSNKAIGTTWGYDLLIKKQIPCTDIKGLYCISDALNSPNKKPLVKKIQQLKELKEFNDAKEKHEMTEAKKQPTEFLHEFKMGNELAQTVHIAGDFNAWKPDDIELKKDETDGLWKGSKMLKIDKARDFYQYKFIIDGVDWVINDLEPICTDPQGNQNNKVDVPSGVKKFDGAEVKQIPLGDDHWYDIRYARQVLNHVHEQCNNFDAEIAIERPTLDLMVTTRQFKTGELENFDSYVSIQRFCTHNDDISAFGGNPNHQSDLNYHHSIDLPGQIAEVVFVGYLDTTDDSHVQDNNAQLIQPSDKFALHTFEKLDGFCTVEDVYDDNCRVDWQYDRLNFTTIPKGFVCLLKVKKSQMVCNAVNELRHLINHSNLKMMIEPIPEVGINHLLYRCSNEEFDISGGNRGPYGLQQGQFSYAGIASVVQIIRHHKSMTSMYYEENEIAQQLIQNIREGPWLLEYTINRLKTYDEEQPDMRFSNLLQYLSIYETCVKKLPNQMKLAYVVELYDTLYQALKEDILINRQIDDFICGTQDPLAELLGLSVYQFYARVPSAYFLKHKDTMCAGLCHFSTGFVRCWGRDTFIALRGLLITTGYEAEARSIILYFAKVMRHGLIPNLHDGGNNTRFNARDATWFFLQSIKDFVSITDNGIDLLQTKFTPHFHDNDQDKHIEKKLDMDFKQQQKTIEQLILDILTEHAEGIEYTEWNAGEKIDAHMTQEGFNVKITCDHDKTGFCFGGNKSNCGTWMDKMGSSEGAGNKGRPATPRDGAPIELVAMQFSVLNWLAELNQKGSFKESGVKYGSKEIKFREWAAKIKNNFEACFWIPEDELEDVNYEVETERVNRRGIYKDVYGSEEFYHDYQLRPNVCVAMAFAPEIFSVDKARICLKKVETILMEKDCMGIKTLDPNDYNYRGDYHNTDDTHGINYHQGPEWVWPVGFFLKSLLIFGEFNSKDHARQEVMKWLLPHKQHILSFENKYQGLPELTNSHGSVCVDGCVTQAWSVSTIIDALRDLYYY